MIGIKAALALYTVLIAIALWTLKGTALYIAIVVVIGVAAKAVLHHLRSRIE